MTPELKAAAEAVQFQVAAGNTLINFKWVGRDFRQRGATQHQFQRLAGLGLLKRKYDTHQGDTVYYEAVLDHPGWAEVTKE